MKHSNNISEISGYKVPKAYFENFKVDLDNKTKIEDKSGFVVPDNYFDNLNIEIRQEAKVRKLNEFYKTIAVAASLLIILGTLLSGLLIKETPETSFNFSKLDQSEIESYLEYELMMDNDVYVDDENLELDFSKQDLKGNAVIENMDDSTLEQLIDY